ncbi:MAG TPA: TlyA family RNA methyltransferase [Propionibacteriaceae bacterium]|nr:TlyA family RNA methyltransferase [Propionibacteriaceae bacterium]
MTKTTRLDVELVQRGLARSRAHAQQLIGAAAVRVNGLVIRRPAQRVTPEDDLDAPAEHYVSRAAAKLIGALDDLAVAVPVRALDAGSSTGGFTQVLLERGCQRVYAVDVGTDQLAPTLRADSRVALWERTNLRDLELRHVDHDPVDLVVADVSFISLVLLLAPLGAVTARTGRLLLMVKPQFEVGRELLGSGGVVRSPADRARAVRTVVTAAREQGWHAHGLVASQRPGPAGNAEYFVLLGRTPVDAELDVEAVVDS